MTSTIDVIHDHMGHPTAAEYCLPRPRPGGGVNGNLRELNRISRVQIVMSTN